MHDDGAPTRVRLLPAREAPPLPAPDASGRAVLERAAAGADLVVLGAAGTGKTSLALRLLSDAVAAGRDALLLAPTRARADALRQRSAHLMRERGVGDGAVRVRTPAGYAFMVLTTFLTRRRDPLPAPVLLAGAEEDAALADLIDPRQWPGLPPEAVASRAFRTEVRNLLARAGELKVDADRLAALGRELGIPVWGPASALLRTWDAQGRPTARRRSETRGLDTARIQDRAVEALEDWDAPGVLDRPPVPDLVVVDDYQDCTAATARLLSALARPDAAGRRARVVVLGDPDVAVETFRGGAPSLLVEAEDDSGLAAERLTLDAVHRGNPALHAVWRDQAGRVPVTGTASHRGALMAAAPGEPEAPVAGADEADSGGPGGAEVVVASSPAQEAAHVARMLRGERIHRSTPWDSMAVIVRSAGRAQVVARELRRRGVPLATTAPAVLLRAEPATGAILATARAALAGRLGGADAPPERPSALDLLTSPLVGLSSLDLRRLRRRLRLDRPAEALPDENLLAALDSPGAASALAEGLAREPLAEQAARLAAAARIVSAARAACGTGDEDETGGSGTGDGGRPERIDAEALLWAIWDASGCAERWRSTALGADSDPLLAEAAERDLDTVTALFKRAEVWAERHPGEDASSFLAELLDEVLPSDSVAPQGVRPAGVAILTPASAAGDEWDVVAVMGVGRDAWPDLRLRDTITRSGLLVDAVTGRLPAPPSGRGGAAVDTAAARSQVRADERRMLLAALTRARRRLLVTAVADADNAPSAFLVEVARAARVPVQDADGDPVIAPDTGDLTLRGLVGELRRAAVSGLLPGASPAERERARSAAALLAELGRDGPGPGVAGALPEDWAGIAAPTSTAPLVGRDDAVRISPSDVEAIAACPLRWFLLRQGGGTGPSTPQTLGLLVHDVAEQAQREGLRGEALRARFEERLPDLAYPDTWLGDLAADHARQLIDRLDSYLSGVSGRVDVERRVDVRLDLPAPAGAGDAAGAGDTAGARGSVAVRLRGRIDRIEYVDGAPSSTGEQDRPDDPLPDGRGERVRLIDLKTGARRPKDEDAARNPQLAAYRLALETKGYVVAGGALVLLGAPPLRDGLTILAPKGAALADSPDPRTGRDWARELVASAAADARGARLTARTGAHCARCIVRDSCPAVPEGRRTAS